MRTKRLIALAMAACILCLLLVSCGGGGASGKTVIKWWVADPESWCAGYREIVKQYEEQNPDIKIEFATYPDNLGEKLRAAEAAKQAPDIYGEVIAVAGEDLFLDLTPFMEADGFDPDEIYHQPYFDIWCTLNGKPYALPRDIFSTVICYNKTMFDEAGVAYPEEGWTMDDLIETATKLTNAEEDKFGILISDDFYTYFQWFWMYGADQFSEDGSIAEGYMNSPEMNEFYTMVHDVIHEKNIAPTPSQQNAFGKRSEAGGGSSNMFEMGNIAMMPIERYAVGDYQAAELDIGVVSFPVNDKGEQWVYGSMPTWGISKDSKNPEEAWKFLKFAYGPEGSRILADTGYFFPAVKSVAEDMNLADDPIDGVFLAQLESDDMTKMPFLWRRPADWNGFYAPEVDGPVFDAFNEMMVNSKGVGESLDKAAANMQKALDDYRVQKGQTGEEEPAE